MEISLRLRRVRDLMGYSQRQMADELKVTNGAIALWESGRRPIPGPVVRLIELYELELGIDSAQFAKPESDINELKIVESNRVQKQVKLGTLLFKEWLSYVFQSILTSDSKKSQLQKHIQIKVAKRILESVDEMKGLPLKLGQVLSYLSFSLSEEAKNILSRMQDNASPIPSKQIDDIFRINFGKEPKQIFKKWQSKPFAVASIGQVHLAQLFDGTQVAVKVQFPNIKKLIADDIKVLSYFSPILRYFVVQKETDGIITELKERLLEECNYLDEADNQILFGKLFENDPTIRIPKVYRDLCRSDILVCELCSDISFKDFLRTATFEEKQKAAQSIWRFGFEAIFRHGILNADPHPGNYLFGEDHVTFLDFGSVKRFDPEFIKLWKEFIRAVLERKQNRSIEMLVAMGVLKNESGLDRGHLITLLETVYEAYLLPPPYQYTPDYLSRTFNLWFVNNPNRHLMAFPKDWLYLTRALWGTAAIVIEMKVEATWNQLARDLVYDRISLPIGR